jgi:hypothetical protein
MTVEEKNKKEEDDDEKEGGGGGRFEVTSRYLSTLHMKKVQKKNVRDYVSGAFVM